MTKVRYTVICSIAQAETLPEFLAWLKGGHAQALIDAGALSAEVSVLETEANEGIVVDAAYVFPSRESLQAYFDGPAAELRVDGKTRWIDTGKVSFSRKIGAIDFELQT